MKNNQKKDLSREEINLKLRQYLWGLIIFIGIICLGNPATGIFIILWGITILPFIQKKLKKTSWTIFIIISFLLIFIWILCIQKNENVNIGNTISRDIENNIQNNQINETWSTTDIQKDITIEKEKNNAQTEDNLKIEQKEIIIDNTDTSINNNDIQNIDTPINTQETTVNENNTIEELSDGTKVYKNSVCDHIYYRWPRWWCYYINSENNKIYDTSKECCQNK